MIRRKGSTVVTLAVLVIVAALIAPPPFVPTARAATCTRSVGPGIPPPSSVPSGLYYFHASWYGQSGYPTLCPGETSTATIAYYNAGTEGWYPGRMGQMAFLGTWWPEPGQDRASPLGGDGTNGSPATGWPRYNRVAAQPGYVGPGQVAWFQFTIRAPATPGTYLLYVRPLIEGTLWMEDAGVYWQVTVKTDDAEQSVILDSASTAEDRFVAGGSTFRYDSSDTFQHLGAVVTMAQFEQVLSRGDTVTMRYESDPAARSAFNVAVDVGQGAPRLFITSEQGGSRMHITIHEPAQNLDGLRYSLQRGTFDGTLTSPPWCDASSAAAYVEIATVTIPPGADTIVYTDSPPSGTHCYRAGAPNPITGAIAFGYSVAVSTR